MFAIEASCSGAAVVDMKPCTSFSLSLWLFALQQRGFANHRRYGVSVSARVRVCVLTCVRVWFRLAKWLLDGIQGSSGIFELSRLCRKLNE